MNFLEQLLTEWFTYNEYFVRTNIKMKRRSKGGRDNEVDVLADHPGKKEVIHAEPSSDAASWDQRRKKCLEKKFVFKDEDYRQLIRGAEVTAIKKWAIVGFSQSRRVDLDWGQGIEVILIPKFMRQITDRLRDESPAKKAIPENFPILRGIQFALHFGGGRTSTQKPVW